MERSAGILVYRKADASCGERVDSLEVLLGHLGGPYWARKDDGAWTIPKGLVDDGEDDWDAARREFVEETGHAVPDGVLADLGLLRQNSKKDLHVWAVAGTIDATTCVSNTFELEWPPKSGRRREFPELDRFAWFDLTTARERIVQGQRPVLDALQTARTA